jgi:hypothetical protein
LSCRDAIGGGEGFAILNFARIPGGPTFQAQNPRILRVDFLVEAAFVVVFQRREAQNSRGFEQNGIARAASKFRRALRYRVAAKHGFSFQRTYRAEHRRDWIRA